MSKLQSFFQHEGFPSPFKADQVHDSEDEEQKGAKISPFYLFSQ